MEFLDNFPTYRHTKLVGGNVRVDHNSGVTRGLGSKWLVRPLLRVIPSFGRVSPGFISIAESRYSRVKHQHEVLCDLHITRASITRPSHKRMVWYNGCLYQATSWKTAGRVVAKVEHHPGVPAAKQTGAGKSRTSAPQNGPSEPHCHPKTP